MEGSVRSEQGGTKLNQSPWYSHLLPHCPAGPPKPPWDGGQESSAQVLTKGFWTSQAPARTGSLRMPFKSEGQQGEI